MGCYRCCLVSCDIAIKSPSHGKAACPAVAVTFMSQGGCIQKILLQSVL